MQKGVEIAVKAANGFGNLVGLVPTVPVFRAVLRFVLLSGLLSIAIYKSVVARNHESIRI